MGAERRERLGPVIEEAGTSFSVWSPAAERVDLCLFDEAGERETGRFAMARTEAGEHDAFVGGLKAGARYGLRAHGAYDPARGLWFDPDKLLVDPYALAIDRPFAFDPRLCAQRGEGADTAALVPKGIVTALPDPPPAAPPFFEPGGLIYELQVRAFTMRHPAIAPAERGTIAALRHPAIIDHLTKLRVSAVELMPVAAWIDERHLPPVGLANAWGYNPVVFKALDPRLAPDGLAELRATVEALHRAGIGVILDVVFNHTGEGDVAGPTLSMRGLDNPGYYRHSPDDPGRLVNDTGCGNTLACGAAPVDDLILDAMRHFIVNAGVDGFRFDLAPILGRNGNGFDPAAPLFRAIRDDPLLGGRVLIAEPWDVGADGYQLGRFPASFLEWNDRYRDDLRRFWRGDGGMAGPLATRLAGSSDAFGAEGAATTRTVNFVAAHDGMAMADLVAYQDKHNEANGEGNRDGTDDNNSWNCGVEGGTPDVAIAERRRQDVAAMLATLFVSRGTIMLTAGDEFGRSQRGNNNAYAQDNEITWLDWRGADLGLCGFVYDLAETRHDFSVLSDRGFFSGATGEDGGIPDVAWLTEEGVPLDAASWNEPDRRALAMVLRCRPGDPASRLALLFNGYHYPRAFVLPGRHGFSWHVLAASADTGAATGEGMFSAPERSLVLFAERQA